MPLFNGDWLGSVVWIVFFMVMIFFYPKLMLSQMLWKLESTARALENMTATGKRIVLRRISKTPTKEVKEAVNNFLEFFVIEPVSLDPFGIVKKIEHVVNLQEKRFKYFVKSVAPKFDSETQANLIMGMSGAISLNQISKIVRHFIELARKTKNLQYAMILQMQLPLIERVCKALLKGTEALSNGWPIGDSIGLYAVTNFIDRTKEVEENTLLASKRIKGKSVLFVRAKGPGGRLGKLGRVVEKLTKRQRIAKIVTIDAAAKLEGERTGAIAEGVGVAIGGVGVDRAYIENIATNQDIPLDSIVIKMLAEEAIMPMKSEILNANQRVVKLIEKSIQQTRGKGKIIVVGVGNSCGVNNNKKALKATEEQIRKIAKMMKKREELEKKKEKRWIDFLSGFP